MGIGIAFPGPAEGSAFSGVGMKIPIQDVAGITVRKIHGSRKKLAGIAAAELRRKGISRWPVSIQSQPGSLFPVRLLEGLFRDQSVRFNRGPIVKLVGLCPFGMIVFGRTGPFPPGENIVADGNR